ncbi:PTS system mannose/fructose/sorbose family transporter subunit IID [Amycolatopsis sp. CM201R]|uniref:PTS system mannose/fructose/sorbose family transporter subunit IID n=1 Tax=Amycolatopsis sp. 505 TaxID=2761538 RepID=UPI0028755915|nr:PTS system mannose/fructose/sorbose family transporter subunit IID [Amycolatopsis sp. 505]MDS0139212.1 PTS system mannose/fructose/sorbose family transporter subunit IID [Amycolatopsis sp. 505]MDS0144444.1 PTS system mannose/fructose/sorbose family transporter subunit IID [Amycolatopsis sp. CM201R]
MLVALALTLWAIYCTYDGLGPFLIYAQRPLIAGSVAGLITGHPLLGLLIGATLELAALGVYTYGGATIPDYQTGAIVGTALAAGAAGAPAAQAAIGIGVGLPAAILLAALDPVGKMVTTGLVHRADGYAADGNARGLAMIHWVSLVPWVAVRAVPTFLAALAASGGLVKDITASIPAGFVQGMTLAGSLLPAVGFALLLGMMELSRYWYLLLIGFVGFAYLHLPVLGIALIGVAVAMLFVTLKRDEPAIAVPEAPADESTVDPRLTKQDLRRVFRRYFWSSQISWNYERMQALGFAYSMEPVLRRLYPEKADYVAGLQRHLQFFNTSVLVGGPLILGSSVALEEAGTPKSAASTKVALMGPMAGIGDTVVFALYNSIVFTMGASWALQGNWLGPAFAAVMVLVPYALVRRWQFSFAYREGKRLAGHLAAGALARVAQGATVLGFVVLGGFIPSIVKVVTTLTYRQTTTVQGQPVTQSVAIQDRLDELLPFLLPVLVTAGVYLLTVKARLRPVWVIGIVVVAGVVLGWLGWFAPSAPAKG